jgi:hypothetical protein
MFLLRTGPGGPGKYPLLPVAGLMRAGVCLLCLATLAGCNATSRGPTAQWPGEPQHLAAAVPGPFVEMEDDGQPGQIPPPPRVRQAPDEPHEPYSRNYGTLPPRAAEAAKPGRPGIPSDLPPDFRRKLASAMED